MVERVAVGVFMINMLTKSATLTNGKTVPMTDFYGDELDDDGNYLPVPPTFCKRVTLGEDGVGWWNIELKDFDKEVVG